MIRFKQTTTY